MQSFKYSQRKILCRILFNWSFLPVNWYNKKNCGGVLWNFSYLYITWLPLAFESLIIDKMYKGEFTLGDLCKVSDIF